MKFNKEELISNGPLEGILILAAIVAIMLYGYWTSKTDWTGSFSGGVIACLIYLGVGIPGLVYFLIFFITGSQASKWKYQQKVKIGVAQENKGKRTWVHAVSNAGAAAFFALLVFFGFDSGLAHLAIACIFAAATSDTLSSEMGNVLGRQFYHILSFKIDERGKDGVVSMEGSIAGLVGSLLISLLYLMFTFDWSGFAIVFFMGISANAVDSVLGATLQHQKILNNHTVNLVATFIAGIGGIMLYGILYLLLLIIN